MNGLFQANRRGLCENLWAGGSEKNDDIFCRDILQGNVGDKSKRGVCGKGPGFLRQICFCVFCC